MQSMRRHFAFAPAFIMAAALAVTPAIAETTTVKVPFSFDVAGKTFPAGDYWLHRDDQGDYVTLEAKGSRKYFTSCLVGPGAPAPGEHHIALKFDTIGQTHLLQSIQYGALVSGRLDKKALESERISMANSAGQ
jgi:hypothetical protein